ncbi:hypothetical protein ACIPWY_03270 [Streptomyces sp. NPDC090032]|uniref:hypothetical protein n=1 Tax=Streptomyces sp. NPDC090032 TaxID=3365925 RepID=UPI00382800CF
MPIDPVALLDDCERVWCTIERTAVLTRERGRSALVVEALTAYATLAEAAGLDQGVVADRWPACTVHAAAMIAASADGPIRQLIERVPKQLAEAHPQLALEQAETSVDALRARWASAAAQAERHLGAARTSATPETAPHSTQTAQDHGPSRASGDLDIRLGPGGTGVVIALSEPAGGGPWELTADGRTCAATPPYWMLPGPVRRVTATAAGESEHVVPVVDPRTALLAFDADGLLLPAHEALPPTHVTLLHVGPLQVDGGRDAGVELPVPYGWGGWTMTRLSLDGTHRIRATDGAEGHWWDVAAGTSLAWEGGRILDCLRTSDGAAVWSEPPALRLPRRRGETAAEPWRITVQRPGGPPLAQLTGARGSLVEPWRDMPRPLVGAYEIRLDGPGRARRAIAAFLAEGVIAEPSVQWRQFTPSGGLASARARVDGEPLLGFRGSISLGPYDTAKTLELRDTSGRTHGVHLVVPHSELRLETDGSPGPWTVGPLVVEAAELGRRCVLTVRLPDRAVSVEPVVALVVDGVRLHTLRPQRRASTRKGDLRYVLSELADTARDWTEARLHLVVAGQDLPVATLRTQPIAREVVSEGHQLVLRGGRAAGVGAHLYRVLAPWQPAVDAQADDMGRIALPQALRDAGPLIVRLRARAEPDVPPPWPDLRRRDTLVARRLPVAVHGGQDAGSAISAYLAGYGELRPWSRQFAPLVWIVAARGRDLQDCGARTSAPADCRALLAEAGTEALYAAADAGLSTKAIAPVLVATGLAGLRVRDVARPDDVRHVWRHAPLCALLLTAPLLPYLAGGDAYELAELYPQEVHLLDEVGEFAGDGLRTLLASGADPHRGVGRFDARTRALAELPAPQQRALWASVGAVPTALLDESTRVAAAWEAFRARREFSHVALREEGGDWTDALERFLAETAAPLADAVRDRAPGPLRGLDEAWMRVPQLSLGFALVARLAAAGDGRAARLEHSARPVWSALAVRAPELTAVDLVLAEGLVTSVRLTGAAGGNGHA